MIEHELPEIPDNLFNSFLLGPSAGRWLFRPHINYHWTIIDPEGYCHGGLTMDKKFLEEHRASLIEYWQGVVDEQVQTHEPDAGEAKSMLERFKDSQTDFIQDGDPYTGWTHGEQIHTVTDSLIVSD